MGKKKEVIRLDLYIGEAVNYKIFLCEHSLWMFGRCPLPGSNSIEVYGMWFCLVLQISGNVAYTDI
jgi:hypothetical protein